jgi:hypothetical protein
VRYPIRDVEDSKVKNVRRLLGPLLGVFISGLMCSAQSEHRGIVIDATTNHIVVPGGLSAANLKAASRDPRIMMQLQRRYGSLRDGPSPFKKPDRERRGLLTPGSMMVQGQSVTPSGPAEVDWSIPLGTGSVAAQQYPAKYSFTVDDPSCTTDYVVFALNVAGVTGGQANLIGINQLYSGTSPVGYCGKTPHVNWAYNGSTASGAILGSPTLSLDGTKIAYIESAPGSSILHVLTWKAGQGTKATDAASPTVVGKCTATTSCLLSVTYSTTSTTTLSSVWVDYGTDTGYVASDDGRIYKISCVFHCALNTNPTVDWTFSLPVAGTGGALPVPSVPVYDGWQYLFVTDQLGEVWSINVSGTSPVLAGTQVMIGGGGCSITNPAGRTGTSDPCKANGGSYGIPDGPILVTGSESTDDEIVVVSGNNGVTNASAVVAELNYNLTVKITDSIGIGSVGNSTANVDLHHGAFDTLFWGDTPSEGHLFLCGTGTTSATATQPQDYWIGFTNYPTMNSSPSQDPYVTIPISGAPCTGLTEFYNSNLNMGDLLVGGIIDPNDGPLVLDNISNLPLESYVALTFFPGGFSDIIIDNFVNTTTYPQADSLYFSTLAPTSYVSGCSTTPCAIKISQSTLQ